MADRNNMAIIHVAPNTYESGVGTEFTAAVQRAAQEKFAHFLRITRISRGSVKATGAPLNKYYINFEYATPEPIPQEFFLAARIIDTERGNQLCEPTTNPRSSKDRG